MKINFNILLLILFQIGFSQTKIEKEYILLTNNLAESWITFSKTVEIIDNDSESLWAYSEARKIINQSKLSNNVFEKIFLINRAKTLIFYGMSYTKSIMYKSKYPNDSLGENLNIKILTTIYPSGKEFNTKNLIESELMVNESMVNFYLVSQMSSYEKLKKICEDKRTQLSPIKQDKYWLSRYVSNKIANYKIYITFISDIFYIVNNNPSDEQIEKHFNEIIKIGTYLDNLDDNMDLEREVINLVKNDITLINTLNKSINLLKAE